MGKLKGLDYVQFSQIEESEKDGERREKKG